MTALNKLPSPTDLAADVIDVASDVIDSATDALDASGLSGLALDSTIAKATRFSTPTVWLARFLWRKRMAAVLLGAAVAAYAWRKWSASPPDTDKSAEPPSGQGVYGSAIAS